MREHRGLVRARGWVSIAVLLPVILAVVFSPLPFAPASWPRFATDALGWLLFIAGAGMRWWATLYVGGRKKVQLITEGAYSVTRNPLYFGTFLLTLAVAAFSQSIVFCLAILLVSVAYLHFTASMEEEALLALHGKAFEEYLRTVPRFFPRFTRFHSAPTVQIQVHGLWNEGIRAARWSMIPILCDLVNHLRLQEWWPHWGFLVP